MVTFASTWLLAMRAMNIAMMATAQTGMTASIVSLRVAAMAGFMRGLKRATTATINGMTAASPTVSPRVAVTVMSGPIRYPVI
jgi:hypothetical protein